MTIQYSHSAMTDLVEDSACHGVIHMCLDEADVSER